MISGRVSGNREAIISVIVHDAEGGTREVEAIIDTGFDGSLSLPPDVVADMKLPWRRRGQALLADGSTTVFDIYDAVLEWDGKLRRVAVDEANTAPLVGMELLDGFAVTLEVRPGGTVTIQQLS
jgi:clan AA aspartic protease